MKVTASEQKFLLKLARQCLDYYFQTDKQYQVRSDVVPANLQQDVATFVTLTIAGELRGCIGKLEATQPLYRDVIENTYLAAFNDWRFDPLRKTELAKIKIEISILSAPHPMNYQGSNDLISKLSAEKPGVIINYQGQQATFLPQVWEDLSEPQEFLSQLCLKAGLAANIWKNARLQVMTYTVRHFSEA